MSGLWCQANARAELPLAFLQQAAMAVLQQAGVQAWGPVPAPMARKASSREACPNAVLFKCS